MQYIYSLRKGDYRLVLVVEISWVERAVQLMREMNHLEKKKMFFFSIFNSGP